MPATATRPSADPERVVDAALACFADYGVRKTSLTDVARRAGVSRATAYRLFAGKDELVAAVARAEVARFGVALAAAVGRQERFEDAARAVVGFTLDYLERHAVLQRVLADEPEALVDVIVERPGGTTLIGLLVAGTARAIEPYAGQLRGTPEEVAEWGIRVIFSLLVAPTTVLDGPDRITDLLLRGTLGPVGDG